MSVLGVCCSDDLLMSPEGIDGCDSLRQHRTDYRGLLLILV